MVTSPTSSRIIPKAYDADGVSREPPQLTSKSSLSAFAVKKQKRERDLPIEDEKSEGQSSRVERNDLETEEDVDNVGSFLPRIVDHNPESEQPKEAISSFVETEQSVQAVILADVPTDLITLHAGDRLFIIGIFEFRVTFGTLRFSGAIIKQSEKWHRVFAPLPYDVRPIEGVPSDIAPCTRFQIRGSQSKLSLLGRHVEHHALLWPLQKTLQDLATSSPKIHGRTYHLLNDETRLMYENPPRELEIPRSWMKFLHSVTTEPNFQSSTNAFVAKTYSDKGHSRTSTADGSIFVCGSRGSGKSDFIKLLLNRLLSHLVPPTIFFFDLDPDFPEFTPPGQISLVSIKEYLFGPSFFHTAPISSDQELGSGKMLRSHFVGSDALKESLDHFMACCKDLLHYFRKLSDGILTILIFNAPSWLDEDGIVLLKHIVHMVNAKNVVSLGVNENLDRYLQIIKSSTQVHTLAENLNFARSLSHSQSQSLQTSAYFDSLSSLSSLPSFRFGIGSELPLMLNYITYTSAEPVLSLDLMSLILPYSVVALVFIEKNDDETWLAGQEALCDEDDFCTHIVNRLPPSSHSCCVGRGIVTKVGIGSDKWLDIVTPVPYETIRSWIERKGMIALCYSSGHSFNWIQKVGVTASLARDQNVFAEIKDQVQKDTTQLLKERLRQLSARTDFLSAPNGTSIVGENSMRVRRNLVQR